MHWAAEEGRVRRILIVDDEPMVLSELENALRHLRSKWNVDFVGSADKALSALAGAPFDVVVSDIRMPGMDGPTLLKRVRTAYPKIIRVLLAGPAELETAMRGLSVAHQFVGKPCSGSMLESVVDRACDLEALLSNEAIRGAVGGVDKLPSPPRTYMAVVRVLEDPSSSLGDVAAVIERDIAASAKILQVVNSAFFALRQDVKSVKQALSYLGVDMVRRILLSVEAFGMFDSKLSIGGVSIEAMQEHGVAVGGLANALMAGQASRDDAFMAGMLHDVGRLMLAKQDPARLNRVVEQAKKTATPLHVAEREAFGATHAELGAYLLGLWGLPYSIVEAAAHHHEPLGVRHSTFEVLDAVYIADLLVQEMSGDEGACSPHGELDIAYLESLGVAGNLPGWRNAAARILSESLKKAAS